MKKKSNGIERIILKPNKSNNRFNLTMAFGKQSAKRRSRLLANSPLQVKRNVRWTLRAQKEDAFMSIKWNTKKNIKPQIVLDKIQSEMFVNEDGSVTFSGFEIYEEFPILKTMLSFPDGLEGEEKDSLIWSTLSSVTGAMTKDSILTRINQLYLERNATRDKNYAILTSISVCKAVFANSTIIDDVTIKAVDEYPKKYSSRKAFVDSLGIYKNANPVDYSKIMLIVKEKNPMRAATKALRSLDIYRSILCLFTNSQLEIIGDEWIPINKIRVGEVHTIHEQSGKMATEAFWFEPNFILAKTITPASVVLLKKKCLLTLKRISECAYSEIIKESMVRYVRALDEKDQHIALIKIWSALECITGISDANYDALIRRTSFIFKEYEYHRQILEHLRDHRNRCVHSADQSDKAKIDCFQMQVYIFSLISFHIGHRDTFKSLDEALYFLDLPTENALLLTRQYNVIQFRIVWYS